MARKIKKSSFTKKTFNRAVTLAAAPLVLSIGTEVLSRQFKIPRAKAFKEMKAALKRRLKKG